MNEKDVVERLEAVRDRATFIAFVKTLAEDRRLEEEEARTLPSSPWGPGPRGWQNATVEKFLTAAGDWAEAVADLGGERAKWLPEEPSWAAFARLLYMAKVYE